MNFKDVVNLFKSKFFWANVGIAALIFVALVTATMFALNGVTKHNESIEVPNLEGMYVEEAQLELQKLGMSLEVVDSMYVRDKSQGEIIDQVPVAFSHVKSGRKIYLTINSKLDKMVAVPELHNVSYRQAKATLEAIGFEIIALEYRPSEFANLVLDVKYEGRSVQAGERLKDGAAIVLVVGDNSGGETTIVPDLNGMSTDDANAMIRDYNLIIGSVDYYPQLNSSSNTADYYIYKQIPAPGETVSQGKRVDIWLTNDSKNIKQLLSTDDDEDFF